MAQSDELQRLSRSELIERATSMGVERAEVLTRVELVDEIIRRTIPDPIERRVARGLLGVARDLVARVVERGLHLPDAAAKIRAKPAASSYPPSRGPIATVTLAEIYAAQGHKMRALHVLDEVLEYEPDHSAARELRDRVAGAVGRECEGASAPAEEPENCAEAQTARTADEGEGAMGQGRDGPIGQEQEDEGAMGQGREDGSACLAAGIPSLRLAEPASEPPMPQGPSRSSSSAGEPVDAGAAVETSPRHDDSESDLGERQTSPWMPAQRASLDAEAPDPDASDEDGVHSDSFHWGEESNTSVWNRPEADASQWEDPTRSAEDVARDTSRGNSYTADPVPNRTEAKDRADPLARDTSRGPDRADTLAPHRLEVEGRADGPVVQDPACDASRGGEAAGGSLRDDGVACSLPHVQDTGGAPDGAGLLEPQWEVRERDTLTREGEVRDTLPWKASDSLYFPSAEPTTLHSPGAARPAPGSPAPEAWLVSVSMNDPCPSDLGAALEQQVPGQGLLHSLHRKSTSASAVLGDKQEQEEVPATTRSGVPSSAPAVVTDDLAASVSGSAAPADARRGRTSVCPDATGNEPDSVVVIEAEPGNAYLYWEISTQTAAMMEAEMGPGEFVVRLLVAEPAWSGPIVQVRDRPMGELTGGCSVTDIPAHSTLRAALGWRCKAGFQPLAVALNARAVPGAPPRGNVRGDHATPSGEGDSPPIVGSFC